MSIIEKALAKGGKSGGNEGARARHEQAQASGPEATLNPEMLSRAGKLKDMSGVSVLGYQETVIGKLLIAAGKLTDQQVNQITELQGRESLLFGEAALKLGYVTENDILHALSRQYNYVVYDPAREQYAADLVTAYQPLSPQAETIRNICTQLLLNWLNLDSKTLVVVSPGSAEGKSFMAANLAMVFSQLGKETLLIDADLRAPRQHKIFNFENRIGLSSLLAGRISQEDLGRLPEKIGVASNLSVLGAGPPPPIPVKLMIEHRWPMILQELKKHYEVIIIDTPDGEHQADVRAIAVRADSALLVLRKDKTRMADAQALRESLDKVNVKIVGAVMNEH